MKHYSHDDVYSSFVAMTPLSIEQIEVAMNSLTPVPSSDRERIRMELWKDVFTQSLRNDDMSMGDCEDEAQLSVAAFDKQFPNS